MTASSLAHLLHGKRYKQGAWKARCPVHQEKTASLSIREGKTAILIKCFGCGADGTAVMKALGLPTRQLFYSSTVLPEVRLRMSDEAYLEAMEHRLGKIDMMCSVEKHKRHYWEAAIEVTEQEIIKLRRKLYPDKNLPARFRGTRLKETKANRKILDMIFDLDKDGEFGWSE